MSWLLSGTCVFEQGPGRALLHTSEIKRAEFLAGVLEGRWKKKGRKGMEIKRDRATGTRTVLTSFNCSFKRSKYPDWKP